jgi:hypothetical protein
MPQLTWEYPDQHHKSLRRGSLKRPRTNEETMKTWMKSVVPLFTLALTPLAHAQEPVERAATQVMATVPGTGTASQESQQVRELGEAVDRLSRRIVELEARREARDIRQADVNDHGGWW